MDTLLGDVCDLINCFSEEQIDTICVHNYVIEVEEQITIIEDDSVVFKTWVRKLNKFIGIIRVALFNGSLEDIKDYVLEHQKSYAVY